MAPSQMKTYMPAIGSPETKIHFWEMFSQVFPISLPNNVVWMNPRWIVWGFVKKEREVGYAFLFLVERQVDCWAMGVMWLKVGGWSPCISQMEFSYWSVEIDSVRRCRVCESHGGNSKGPRSATESLPERDRRVDHCIWVLLEGVTSGRICTQWS